MKRNLIYVLTFLLFFSGKILAGTYNIIDFGAIGDGVFLNTKAINDAVTTCNEKGGGTVIIPAGIFRTGSIILKSNVNLHLEQGAELLGSEDVQDYMVMNKRSNLISCRDAVNVSITGLGTIHAQGIKFYETDKNHVYDEFDKSRTRQKENYMTEGTFFTDGPLKRKPNPGMSIVFFHCSQVTVTGVTIKDTPSWAMRLGYCEGVLIDGITIQNNLLIPNSDGIHCTASRNVRISNCNIVAGDDAIIMTGFPMDEETPGVSSKEQDMYTNGNKSVYAENLTVTNCILKSSSSGIRVGYGQHPIRRCYFDNIVIHDSHRGIGIFAHDGSNIEDLSFSNIFIETRLRNGQWWGHGEPIHMSCISRFEGIPAGQIKNVRFNNINAIGEQGILIFGLKESQMENIQFVNIQLRMRKGKETLAYGGNFDLRPATPRSMQIFEHDIPGIYAQYVNGLYIQNFNLSWENDLPSFFTHGIEANNFNDLTIDHFTGGAARENVATIKVSEGKGFKVTNSIFKGQKPFVVKKNVSSAQLRL